MSLIHVTKWLKIDIYLGWGHQNNGGITGLDFLGEVFHFLSGSSVDLFLKFGELKT